MSILLENFFNNRPKAVDSKGVRGDRLVSAVRNVVSCTGSRMRAAQLSPDRPTAKNPSKPQISPIF